MKCSSVPGESSSITYNTVLYLTTQITHLILPYTMHRVSQFLDCPYITIKLVYKEIFILVATTEFPTFRLKKFQFSQISLLMTSETLCKMFDSFQ